MEDGIESARRFYRLEEAIGNAILRDADVICIERGYAALHGIGNGSACSVPKPEGFDS